MAAVRGITKYVSPIDRFWLRVKKVESGCWEWQGFLNGDGYGSLMVDRKRTFAHRFSFEEFIGKIPEGMSIDHLCRNRACVNPFHLEVVDHRENMLRGETVYARRSRQTHCIHGHELSGRNLVIIISKKGNAQRRCRACAVERTRRYRAKK